MLVLVHTNHASKSLKIFFYYSKGCSYSAAASYSVAEQCVSALSKRL